MYTRKSIKLICYTILFDYFPLFTKFPSPILDVSVNKNCSADLQLQDINQLLVSKGLHRGGKICLYLQQDDAWIQRLDVVTHQLVKKFDF